MKSALCKLGGRIRRHPYILLTVLFALLFLFIGLHIHQPFTQEASQGLNAIVSEPDIRLEDANRVNLDSLAWIRIPDTPVDYPVQQAADNDYYLRRDAKGNYDNHGCVFADYECKLQDTRNLSRNLILYGHTFSDEDYEGGFKILHQYQKQEFGREHPYIYISISDATLTYQVFSVGFCKVAEDYDCIYADPDDAGFQTILDKAMKRSIYDFGVDVTEDDHILTLSTCTGFNQSRLLVVAKLVDAVQDDGVR